MYKLNYFTENDQQKIIEFIKEFPFGMVCSNHDKYPAATQVPIYLEEKNGEIFLTGHIMKNTDHHKAFAENENVLVIFTGHHSYISSSWYTNPKVASTWNYMSVHVKGPIKFTDESGTLEIIEHLTDQYERKENPGSFKNLPSEYVHKLVKAIIGFHIKVDEIDATFKLSQNHEIENRELIISELLKQGNDNAVGIAKEMQARITSPKLNR